MEIQLSSVAEIRNRNSRLQKAASALFVVALVFWFINLGVILGIVDASSPLHWIGVDLSTVSTFVFVLLFFYLSRQCARNVRDIKMAPEEITEKGLPSSAYPAGFTFFLVMLGLAGTLLGLYIGLFSDDIKATAGSGETQAVSQMIEQLLNGAATALLSSLWALVAAFLAASPIRACYEWACYTGEPIEEESLDATLRQLVDDLRSLSVASRIATGNLEATGEGCVKAGRTGDEAADSTATATSLEQSMRTNQLLEQLVGLLSQNVEHGLRQREAADKALAAYVDTVRGK